MRALLLMLLLAGPARARDAVTFWTDPPGLTVYQKSADTAELSPLGRAGESLELPAAGRRLIQFGYGSWVDPALHSVDLKEATRDQRWPARESQKVDLPWSVWVRYQMAERWLWWGAGLLLAGALLAGPLFAFGRLGREARRARALDRLKASISDPDPNLFKVIAGYRLVSRLGRGGMADVYRGLPNDTLDETAAVALKLIQTHAASLEEFRTRFRREAEVGARLSHPNIIRVLDAGDQDGLLYIVMELIDGQSLRQLLQSGLRDWWAILEPTLLALEFAHKQGVVHRDLKPDNTMITASGRVVVMDFGLARRHDFSTVTASGSVLGTPAYMSPEQIQGKPLDGASDQYALGIMACELVMGHGPYPEIADPVQTVLQHLYNEPELEQADGRFRPILARMLAKDPGQRFPDLAECRQAWERARG